MRIRTIKPEFWTHPVMSRQSVGARLLALALLNYADDSGYFYADTDLVRGAVMCREDSTNVRRWIDELSRIGFIDVREHPTHGKLGLVVGFAEHQKIDRPKPSIIAGLWDSTTARRLIDDQSPLYQGTGNREQGTGNEGTREAEKLPDQAEQSQTAPQSIDPTIRGVLDGLTESLMESNRRKSRHWKPLTTMLVAWPAELYDLIESRGMTVQELASVLNWTQSDAFWSGVIQSPADLAKNLDKIIPQMKRSRGGVIAATPAQDQAAIEASHAF